DNDPFKHGRQIHGIDVLGGVDDLPRIIEHHAVEGIILTTSSTNLDVLEPSYKQIKSKGIWVQRLRIEFEPVRYSQIATENINKNTL
ncbi:MAG: hypothetical protein PVG32_11500, partial [Anaerolineales bacterium]